jgi:hypothetical protein
LITAKSITSIANVNFAFALLVSKILARITKKIGETMPERRIWVAPARLRELEEGKAPREVTFCLDEAEQAEYRRRWLDGEEIADIRRDIERRKEKALEAAQEGAADEPETPQSDRWKSPAYRGSEPSY